MLQFGVGTILKDTSYAQQGKYIINSNIVKYNYNLK